MKIDMHCHTTNRLLEESVQKADTAAIIEEMKKYEIEETVLLATYFPHKSSGISNFRLLHWIKNHPELTMFGSLDFEHYLHQGMNELNELAEAQLIKGIKLYTCYQNIALYSLDFREIIKIAEKYSLPLMFHAGYSHSSMRKYNKISIAGTVKPGDLEFIAEKYDVDVIISHLGKPFIDDTIETIKRNPRIYTDMSGLIDSKYEANEIPECISSIRKVISECGPKKLIFGTDFPVQTHKDSIDMLEQAAIGFSETDKQDIYYNNARIILGY